MDYENVSVNHGTILFPRDREKIARATRRYLLKLHDTNKRVGVGIVHEMHRGTVKSMRQTV
jgi:hypothetical protein